MTGNPAAMRTRAPLAGALLLWCALVFAGQPVEVTRVIDGDTVILESGDHVRLVGINAPEKEREDRPAQPFSLEAGLLLAELVEGRRVNLEPENPERDRYDRLLASLYLEDGTDVQARLLQRGYAAVIAVPPNLDHLERYIEVEAAARAQQLGIWGDGFFRPRRVEEAGSLEGGFQFLRGRVTDVSRSRKNVRLTLDEGLVVLVYHGDWKRHWRGQKPDHLDGRLLEVRGWVSTRFDEPMVRVHHPSMLVELSP